MTYFRSGGRSAPISLNFRSAHSLLGFTLSDSR